MLKTHKDAVFGVGIDAVKAPTDKVDMCKGLNPLYKDMCQGYTTYLESCPSFINDICQEDVGGKEKIRAPCPSYLKCYYCLRINPL
jgi:hypothetical protein